MKAVVTWFSFGIVVVILTSSIFKDDMKLIASGMFVALLYAATLHWKYKSWKKNNRLKGFLSAERNKERISLHLFVLALAIPMIVQQNLDEGWQNMLLLDIFIALEYGVFAYLITKFYRQNEVYYNSEYIGYKFDFDSNCYFKDLDSWSLQGGRLTLKIKEEELLIYVPKDTFLLKVLKREYAEKRLELEVGNAVVLDQVRELAQLSRGYNLRGKQKHSRDFLFKYGQFYDNINNHVFTDIKGAPELLEELPEPFDLSISFDKANLGVTSKDWIIFAIVFLVIVLYSFYGVVLLFEGEQDFVGPVGLAGALSFMIASHLRSLYRNRHGKHEKKFKNLTTTLTDLYVVLKKKEKA